MADNNDIIIFQSVFKIGTVCSVDGREVKVKVDKLKNSSHLIYKGELVKNVSVGSYVKIIKGFIPIIGKVESEFIVPSKEKQDTNYHSPEEKIDRLLIIKLLGYLESDKYCRGIKELPLIDNECYLLTNEEFTKIHYFVKDSNDVPLRIGTLASDSFVPIELGVSTLFSSHIGIFGNTGSGKSYTLSKLYRQLFVHYADNSTFKANAKFLFFDFNSEYAGEKTIIAGKKIYNLSTAKVGENDSRDKLPLNNSDFLKEDILCIFANATEKTQAPFISRCLKLTERIDNGHINFNIELQKVIEKVFSMADKTNAFKLIDYIESILKNEYGQILDSNNNEVNVRDDFSFHDTNKYFYLVNQQPAHTQKLSENNLFQQTKLYSIATNFKFSNNIIDKFINIMYFRLVSDVIENRANNEHIAPVINRLRKERRNIENLFDFSNQNIDFWNDSNIVVINLNKVNIASKKMLPLLLAHKLYSEHKENRNEKVLNIVIDEAHNILSRQSDRESETWKDYRLEVFEEISKKVENSAYL